MLKLLGAVFVASGGALAWRIQWLERKRKRDTLTDLHTAFRRMGEEVRMVRTPLPALLKGLASDCGSETAAFFTAASKAAAGGEDFPAVWRREAEVLPLDEGAQAAVVSLGNDMQGDEENICKAISHVTYVLAKSAGEAAEKRPEEEKRAAALWFSASALLVILLM